MCQPHLEAECWSFTNQTPPNNMQTRSNVSPALTMKDMYPTDIQGKQWKLVTSNRKMENERA
jgi:hypothetical protein